MFFDLKPPLPSWVGYQCIRHKLTIKEKIMTKKLSDFIWKYLTEPICDLIITYYKKKHNDPDIRLNTRIK